MFEELLLYLLLGVVIVLVLMSKSLVSIWGAATTVKPKKASKEELDKQEIKEELKNIEAQKQVLNQIKDIQQDDTQKPLGVIQDLDDEKLVELLTPKTTVDSEDDEASIIIRLVTHFVTCIDKISKHHHNLHQAHFDYPEEYAANLEYAYTSISEIQSLIEELKLECDQPTLINYAREILRRVNKVEECFLGLEQVQDYKHNGEERVKEILEELKILNSNLINKAAKLNLNLGSNTLLELYESNPNCFLYNSKKSASKT